MKNNNNKDHICSVINFAAKCSHAQQMNINPNKV
jgi:hypothetical protein